MRPRRRISTEFDVIRNYAIFCPNDLCATLTHKSGPTTFDAGPE